MNINCKPSDVPALRTSTGIVIALPSAIHQAEFALPGNSREYPNLVAAYDGESRTGAYFTYQSKLWVMMTPVRREDFFPMLEILNATLAPGANPTDAANLAGILPGASSLNH